ncbi:MAG TPA: MFS transporter [Trinickia sp.]|nr:MFS transporter [Trinickia sp.]
MNVGHSADASAIGIASEPALRRAYASSEWRIIPILFCLWLLAWVDRANVAFAKLQMLSDLHFNEIVYGLGAGLFFLGYVVFGIPTGLVQQRIGARRTISAIVIGWGATSVAMIFVSKPIPFYVLRFLLGAFEAGFYPGVILYFNSWFPTKRRTRNFSIFHSAAICSTVVVGLSGGFALEHLSGVLSLAGWRWMFLVQAAPTLLIGLLVWFVLPDSPATAPWLSPEERTLIENDLARDRGPAASGTETRPVFTNPVVWVLVLTYFSILTANSALSFYIPTILREAGFGGYSAIGNAIAVICILGALGNIALSTYASRHREVRFLCAIASLLSVASLLVLVFVWHSSRMATFVTLIIALAGTGAGISLFWQTPARYLQAGALAVAVPFISSVANIAGFLTPSLTGYVREMSGTYAGGFVGAACVQALAAVLLIVALPLVLRRRAHIEACEKC